MSTQRFYIFGVPDGFNMLSGTPEEIKYFQNFYNGSKKGVELVVHRRKNGETSYNNVVRNILSTTGREGAFLGMSVVFTDNEYCYNIGKIRELFDAVYNNLILKDGVMLHPIAMGQGPVAKFCFSKFEDNQEYYQKIVRILQNNIQQSFGPYMRVYDGNFSSSNSGLMKYLPLASSELAFVNALKEYSYVTLSSEVVIEEKPKLAEMFLMELCEEVEKHQNYIIKGYQRLLSKAEIDNEISIITNYITTLKKYIHQKGVNDLLIKYNELRESFLSIPVDFKPDDTKPEDIKPTEPKPVPPPTPKSSRYSNKIIFGGVLALVVLFVGIVLFLTIPKQGEKKSEPQQQPPVQVETEQQQEQFDLEKFYQLLDAREYNEAFEMIKTITDENRRGGYQTEIDNRINSWYTENILGINDINKLQEIQKQLEKYNLCYTGYNEKIKEIGERIKQLQDQEEAKRRLEEQRKAASANSSYGSPVKNTAPVAVKQIVITQTNSDYQTAKWNGYSKTIMPGETLEEEFKSNTYYTITGVEEWDISRSNGENMHDKLQMVRVDDTDKWRIRFVKKAVGSMTIKSKDGTTITFKVGV